jgi:NAD-dependent dihydropyrimidine dehydrogenase PreA subunit
VSKLTVVLCEPRDDDPPRRRLAEGLLAGLAPRADVQVSVVGPLYDLPADGPGARHLRGLDGDLAVLGWLHARAARWVLAALGVDGRLGDTDEAASASGRTIWCLDLRGQKELETYLREIDRVARLSGGQPLETTVGPAEPHRVEEATATRWYPVIDRGRCVNCLECLNFCLFGVYGLDAAETIRVEQPDACRPGCPACARICPAGAILFPRHADATIAGEATAGGGVPLDVSQLFGSITPERQAAAERDREHCTKSPAPTDLDGLVGKLDDLDL